MKKVSRGYSDVMRELSHIQGNLSNDSKECKMCEALIYGYGTSRTLYVLETHLYREANLKNVVSKLAMQWDGNDYLNGALYVANRFYTEAIPW